MHFPSPRAAITVGTLLSIVMLGLSARAQSQDLDREKPGSNQDRGDQPEPWIGNDAYRSLEQRVLDAEARMSAAEEELASLKGKGLGTAVSWDQAGTASAAGDVPPDASRDSLFGSIGKRLKAIEDKAKADSDTFPKVRLNGFFQFDTGYFGQSAGNIATLGDMQNGSDFRRARLQASGKVTELTNFWLEMDFGSAGAGRPSFMDVWGEQMNLGIFGNVRAGQYRQPISMDGWTNIKHMQFLERSLPFQAFDPFRRVGAMSWRNAGEDDRTMWAASVYGTGVTFWNGVNNYNTLGVDNRFATQIGDQGGVSFAGRASHLLYYDPLAENRYLWHVGGGYNYSIIGGNDTTGAQARTYQARAIPEFAVGDSAAAGATAGVTPFAVDTGRFLADSYQLMHFESAVNWGSANFQTEYFFTWVNQMNGPMVFYNGGYAQAGYFLTGESAGYNKQMGAMDYNVKPFTDFFGLKTGIQGWGAWELAARWSYLDLSATNINAANQAAFTTAGPPASPNAGLLNESTVALNWWWNQYTRVQFNWIHGMLDSNTHGTSIFDIAAVRFQTEF